MKIFKKIFLVVILHVTLFASNVHAQHFFVTDYTNIREFTIDQFTKDIYFNVSEYALRTNLKTNITDTTFFPGFPVFANKEHISCYLGGSDVYLYNFASNSSQLFGLATNNDLRLEFSPNDSAVIFHDKFFELDNYRILDNSNSISVYKNNYNDDYYGLKHIWSSDSTLIRSGMDHSIVHYYIKSGKVDTLVPGQTVFADYFPYPHFAYNDSLNAFAYTIFAVSNTFLNLYYFDTNEIVQLHVGEHEIDFDFLSWSPNNKKLAFITHGIIGGGGGLNVFDLDSNETFEIIPFYDSDGKSHIQWLNSDTLLYSASRGRIMGIKADTSTIIIDVKDEPLLPTSINISNYPNPFNNGTIIQFTLNESAHVKLIIVDVLGKLITELVNEDKYIGTYRVRFNPTDLASGIYYCVANVGDKMITRKIMFLK